MKVRGLFQRFGLEFAVLPSVFLLMAQTSAPALIKWDEYTFKFVPSGQAAQVLDAQGKVVGSIIPMGGELQVIPGVTREFRPAVK